MAPRLLVHLSLFLVVLFASCNNNISSNASNEEESDRPIITSLENLDPALQNENVILEGVLKQYDPTTAGKGGGSQYFDFEILLDDGNTIPITNKISVEKKYVNKDVRLHCLLNDGPISSGIQNINLLRIQEIDTIELISSDENN